jgi:hypothetical protein
MLSLTGKGRLVVYATVVKDAAVIIVTLAVDYLVLRKRDNWSDDSRLACL